MSFTPHLNTRSVGVQKAVTLDITKSKSSSMSSVSDCFGVYWLAHCSLVYNNQQGISYTPTVPDECQLFYFDDQYYKYSRPTYKTILNSTFIYIAYVYKHNYFCLLHFWLGRLGSFPNITWNLNTIKTYFNFHITISVA